MPMAEVVPVVPVAEVVSVTVIAVVGAYTAKGEVSVSFLVLEHICTPFS